MRHRAALALVSLLAAAGCAASPSGPAPGQAGEPFQLRVGAAATTSDGLSIAFDRVASDSRCPIDANCVWAGDAVIVLKMSHRSGRDDVELHTDAGRKRATFLSYTVELVALAPYPQASRPTAPTDYVATLTLSSK